MIKKSIHWTDEHFMRLARQGFKYGWLRRGGSPDDPDYHSAERFVGVNTIDELASLAGKLRCVKDTETVLYGISPNTFKGIGGMPPHHHYMAYIFPDEGKGEWWVMGYVVELWRYGLGEYETYRDISNRA